MNGEPDNKTYNTFIQSLGAALRAGDKPPADRKAWDERRTALRAAMFAAMGPFPQKECAPEPKDVGVLKRDGYRIEKLIFQSRPDVWVTASAYVPESVKGKVPAVLAVHGHYPWARRDPVIQAHCLGLVKLGFFVLAVDAFGAGERHPTPGQGAYHGALLGASLWPAGQTLLGMQVYDNRRAVDYMLTRPEVDGDRLGVTGSSGGGNQTMYAGALDERFKAVVPVCSVGNYQAYLHAACCVCEVLPGALRFTEEGDVLGLVAPRALMVVSATQDSFQFSVAEADKSLERAKAIFKLYDSENKVDHPHFESPHAYNQAMREAMYGWMTQWLQGEGDGKPILEPAHEIETVEDLACFGEGERPKSFMFPTTFAAREAKRLLSAFDHPKHDHKEAWEATAVMLRARLRTEVFGGFPKRVRPDAKSFAAVGKDGVQTRPVKFEPEKGLPLSLLMRSKIGVKGPSPACLLLHLDGKAEALNHPLTAALVEKGCMVVAPDLRATGDAKPEGDAVHGAPDHNSAEHAVWIGRPLLGQWAFDVHCLLDWMALQPGLNAERFSVIGIGQAGVVALCAAATDERIHAVGVYDGFASLVTEEVYAPGTHMGLLAPNLFTVGDVPQLAALMAPRRLFIGGALTPQGAKMLEKDIKEAYRLTLEVYDQLKATDKLTLREESEPEAMAALFVSGNKE
jgi:cephalosporin-C deacetylase-like acetyl esterase